MMVVGKGAKGTVKRNLDDCSFKSKTTWSLCFERRSFCFVVFDRQQSQRCSVARSTTTRPASSLVATRFLHVRAGEIWLCINTPETIISDARKIRQKLIEDLSICLLEDPSSLHSRYGNRAMATYKSYPGCCGIRNSLGTEKETAV